MGKGDYYKNKYGGGKGGGGKGSGKGGDGKGKGDGRGGGGGRGAPHIGGSSDDLLSTLRRIDGAQYGAYHDLEATWDFGGLFKLTIDRAQSDPFASPSRCHVNLSHSITQFPGTLLKSKTRVIALSDFICRKFAEECELVGANVRTEAGSYHGKKGGELTIDKPRQYVLERSSISINKTGDLEARFTVALPARGRTIEGRWCAQILTEILPPLVKRSLISSSLNMEDVKRHILSVEDQVYLRSHLRPLGLVAFVGNGSILPRASGANDKPLVGGNVPVVPFMSPASMEVGIELPNAGLVKGMGIKRGVTLIVGGGFHGKSTLLQALQVGCYEKVLGDGREMVSCDASVVKIRAEDGRSVSNVDISAFIKNLPFRNDTSDFSTEDASGSTSQAAAIIEALEAGSSLFLVDEDTCATNFMIRDQRMQLLVSVDKEPITPFIGRVRDLYLKDDVSSILVVGGAGDYFDVADTVVMMDSYSALDVTARAKQIAQDHNKLAAVAGEEGLMRASDGSTSVFANRQSRIPQAQSFGTDGKVMTRGMNKLCYGDRDLDLSCVEQLVEESQTRAIGDALRAASTHLMDHQTSLVQVLDKIEARLNSVGLDALDPEMHRGQYARPRRVDIAAALNRLRGAAFRKGAPSSANTPPPAPTSAMASS